MWYIHILLMPRSESGAAARVQSAPRREIFAPDTTVISSRFNRRNRKVSVTKIGLSESWWLKILKLPIKSGLFYRWSIKFSWIFSNFSRLLSLAFLHLHETIAAIASSKVAEHPVASHLPRPKMAMNYLELNRIFKNDPFPQALFRPRCQQQLLMRTASRPSVEHAPKGLPKVQCYRGMREIHVVKFVEYLCMCIIYSFICIYTYTYSNKRYSLYRIRITYIDLQQAVDQIPMAGNAGWNTLNLVILPCHSQSIPCNSPYPHFGRNQKIKMLPNKCWYCTWIWKVWEILWLFHSHHMGMGQNPGTLLFTSKWLINGCSSFPEYGLIGFAPCPYMNE